MENLLKLGDLNEKEILSILNLGDQLKYEKKNGIRRSYLEGKTLGMIFAKASTRTRVSFEVGMYDLGGSALFLSNANTQLGRGEPIEDTARVLSRYLDGIMIRTFDQEEVEKLAEFSSIPVINGLTDYCHPCQALADLMTIREYKNTFKGVKLAFIGDGNNMANSLIVGGLKVGMEVSVACPKGYEPDSSIVKRANETGGFTLTDDIYEAAKDADVVYTDVWASMGEEDEVEIRKKAFKGYQVSGDLMKAAKKDAIVLHCLPAHRGEEITADVFESHADEIFNEAENRLHVQKSVMVKLMKDDN